MKVIWAIGAIAVALGMSARADDRPLRIGTEADDAPIAYTDIDGTIKGVEVDIGNALCERMQRKCVWVNMGFDALIPALQAHKIDAAQGQISITAERRKTIDFTDPVTIVPARFVARKDSGISEDPKTLEGKVVGVQSGTTHERYVNERLKGVVTAKVYVTQEEAYLDLEAGRIDATLGDQTLSWDWLQKEGKPDFDFAGAVVNDPEIFGEGTGIALRQDEGELKAALNTALAAIVADGTFDRITKKYFPFSLRAG
jgi:lysine/arginine/ornithine transport system substrate-binding protein